MIKREIEARIIPLKEEVIKVYDVVTAEKIRHRYLDVGGIETLVGRLRSRAFLQGGVSLLLAITAVTEVTKQAFPLVSPDLTPFMATNWPVVGPTLNQLSTVTENPIAIGALAAVGSYFFFKSANRNRLASQKIAGQLKSLQQAHPEDEAIFHTQEEHVHKVHPSEHVDIIEDDDKLHS